MNAGQEEGRDAGDEPGGGAGLHRGRLPHLPHAASPPQPPGHAQHQPDHCVRAIH